MHIRTDFEIPFDREELKSVLGPRLGRSLKRPRVLEQFDYIVSIIPPLIKPRLGWDIFDVDKIEKDKFVLTNGTMIGEGPMIDVLKESTQLVIALCTIGDGIEEELIRLQNEKKMMAAVILDALGSFLVGRVQHQFEFELKADLTDQGLYHNISFSAGSTEWSIEEQRTIFDLLEPEKLGMELSKVYLMAPQKSLSSLFGVSDIPFELDHVKRCEFCPRKETCRMYTAGGI